MKLHGCPGRDCRKNLCKAHLAHIIIIFNLATSQSTNRHTDDSARCLGVIFDSSVSTRYQATKICQTAHYLESGSLVALHICFRKFLTTEATKETSLLFCHFSFGSLQHFVPRRIINSEPVLFAEHPGAIFAVVVVVVGNCVWVFCFWK